MMKLEAASDCFALYGNGNIILRHRSDEPLAYVGTGEEHIEMYRGNFKIEDYVTERLPLRRAKLTLTAEGAEINFEDLLAASIRVKDDLATIDFHALSPDINRFWLRVQAEESETVYGCGEQMSHFNLRGKNFPLWTSEPGVGRNKNTYITWRSDVENKAGGDYYTTNYPQPAFVSSRRYYLNADSTAYADFNFRQSRFHELHFWEVPRSIRIECASTFINLLEKSSAFFGRQGKLPDWVYQGLVIGVQGGTGRALEILDRCLAKGIPVAGLWCQDWQGKKLTSFGQRLRWNWQWDRELYPNLPETIQKLHRRGIRFLGYINPYLLESGNLYEEARAKGYLAVKQDGSDYLVDFGEFYCGVVDFTRAAAFDWYKENIKRDLIAFGLDGWMADFGEYLPTDLKLHNGVSPLLEHNRWPVLWAQCNYEALRETGTLGEIVYFMRAGGTGTQKYCPLLWAGDQSVDFSLDDGLASVMTGALSAGMSGNGLSHSDIGGYTSLFDNCRTKELFLRWAEMNVFSPFMRTHEGNRPDANFQFYDDDDTLAQTARLVKIFTALAPYTKELVAENARRGIPVQRPLFLHYEDDERSYTEQTEYLFGPDLLVAPVYTLGALRRECYLPPAQWLHLWTGCAYGGGVHQIDAPLGKPPVFYRPESKWSGLFAEIGGG
jgi:alpha-glucosidase